jgi:hypothetical protein
MDMAVSVVTKTSSRSQLAIIKGSCTYLGLSCDYELRSSSFTFWIFKRVMAPKKTVSSKKLATPRRIVISEEEFNTGVTSLDNVQAGVEEFQSYGFVILENAIAVDVVDKFCTQMYADADTALTFPNLVFNHGKEKNNFSITPPLSDEFMFEGIWANQHATAIMQQVIGPRPLLCWASSNVSIKSGSDARQTVHSDAYTDIPNFPFCVEMNIYLQDTTPENGSTEIWPGTHVYTEDDHLPHGRGYIKKKSFTDRARICPPIQPTVPAGSILMRDLRLWHSGMPNTTSTPRIMISLIYFTQWFRPHMRLTLPVSVRAKVEAWTHIDLLSNTDFVKGSVDHLHTCFPMNFTQDPAKGLMDYRRAVDKLQGREPGAHLPVTKDNYWTPSKYQTRAAKKRVREDEKDGEEKKKQKQEETKSGGEEEKKSETRQEVDTEQESEVIPQPESKQEVQVKPKADVKQEHETKQARGPDGVQRPWLTQEPKAKRLPEQNTNSVDDLPDYINSPKQTPPWMAKLQEDQNTAAERPSWEIEPGDYNAPFPYNDTQYFPPRIPKARQQQEQGRKTEIKHETDSKQDTKELEDLSDYEDSPVNDVLPHLRGKEAWEQEELGQKAQSWEPDKQELERQVEESISRSQKRTFNLDFVSYAGPGPGISPQFSPKSKPESPRKSNLIQEVELEKRKQSLEKQMQEKRLHEKQLQKKQLQDKAAEFENQEPKATQEQPAAPVAKMIENPKPQEAVPNSPTRSQKTWDLDPRRYKIPRPSSQPAKANPSQSPSTPLSHSPAQYPPPSSPLSHPQTQHPPPPPPPPITPQNPEPKATNAYDAYI